MEPPRLRWVSDAEPGLRRVARGAGFAYLHPDGRPLRDAAALRRIQALAIPPAYEEVWICRRADGHLQATGRDARGRKQYRYHALWQQQRGALKFDGLLYFGRQLPRLRARIGRQLGSGSTPTRDRVLATLIHLLDTVWLRIGNDEYARSNGSYGLTTLRARHARIEGDALRLSFVGKSGVRQQLTLSDRRVARIVRRCRELPGQELFRYVDGDGQTLRIGSADVNASLADWCAPADGPRDGPARSISAKDFRTWHASVMALDALLNHDFDAAGARKPLNEMLGQVAQRLGNTPAVCRKAYVHPAVLARGEGMDSVEAQAALRTQDWAQSPPPRRGLSLAERRLMALLASAKSAALPARRPSVGKLLHARGAPPDSRAAPARR
ncbi:MAG: DNA topoisomerase IB [Burkholderiaceae bacterium]